MPPVAPITPGSNPIANIAYFSSRQEKAQRDMAGTQQVLVNGVTTGTPTPSISTIVTLATQHGLCQIFILEWVERAKDFLRMLKSMNSLASGATT